MSNDSGNLALETELRHLQQVLASARERLRAAAEELPLDALPSSEQHKKRLRPDVERACLICTSLLQDLQLLQHRLDGPAAKERALAGGVTPEMLKWAREQPIDEEEIVADLRDLEETDGLELRDFIREVEQASGQSE